MAINSERDNLILIGMPWSGKSTVGVLVAKALTRQFLDTDVLIQAGEKSRLQAIIDTRGVEVLRRLEEEYILGLDCTGHVIATGGSAVYSGKAMAHLKRGGRCVYLDVPLGELEVRATRVDMRGLVRAPGQTLASLYEERTPLYRQYADITVPCGNGDHEEIVERVRRAAG